MNKLGFACPWGKSKEKSWSGTYWGLYSSLDKYYELDEINTGENQSGIRYLSYKIQRKIKRLLGSYSEDMGLSRMRMMEKQLDQQLKGKDYPLLQFGESPFRYAGKQYIYLDLHAGFVKHLFDNDKETFSLSAYQKVPQKYIYERTEQQNRFFNHAAGIFTMGHWLQKELVENYGLPVASVHHVGGINLDSSRIDDTRKEGNKILFVGRDYKRKGLPLVIEAFKLAKEKRNDIKLYVAGPKTEKIDFEVPDGVTLLGDLSSDALVEYFNMCDIFCMPSVFEAYGLVFPEALTYGLPCIGRDAYEMPYFIEEGKTGYLLKEDSAEELCGYMLDLLQNEKIKKNVKDKREWYIREYSWEAVAERIHAVIG